MYKARRDRHQQKLDQRQHHEELGECAVPDKARERFRRPPYQLTDPVGYMAKKYDIKKEIDALCRVGILKAMSVCAKQS